MVVAHTLVDASSTGHPIFQRGKTMNSTTMEVLQEFAEAEQERGYVRPCNLSEIERCPSNDEDNSQEDSSCPVDTFLRKNKGLR
jgi:hypothetical protein